MSDLKTAAVSGLSSAAGAGTSFFVKTLPVVQWGAAFVAIIAGLITIVIALNKFHAWLKRR
jgi:hypothetical protein